MRIDRFLKRHLFPKHTTAKEREASLLRSYRDLFGSADGKDVLKDLSKYCGLDDLCFDADSERNTSFQLGARSVFLYILNKKNAGDDNG